MIKIRDELPDLFNKLGYKVGAEIGVWRGEFSAHILANWDGFLYSIDCWQQQPPEKYSDIMNQPDNIQEQCYQATLRRLHPYHKRNEIMRTFSRDAAGEFKQTKRMLDFIYFDANHSMVGMLEDLLLWYPIIKKDGLISGHDFLDGDNICGSRFGVKSAVLAFIEDKDVELTVTDEQWPTWLFIKTEDNE